MWKVCLITAPFLTSLFLILSFPDFNLFFLTWFALVPLILFCRKEKSKKRIFYISTASGTLAYFGILYWIIPTIHAAGEGVILGIISLFLLSIYLGAYIGIFMLFVSILPVSWIFAASFFWVLLEYLRNFFLGGFPWALIGYSQWKFLEVIQISELGGVYMVSFLVVLMNCCISESLISKKPKPICIAAILLFGSIVYGNLRIKYFNDEISKSEKIKVAILQGSIDQYKKWSLKYVNEIIDVYTKLAEQAMKEKPALVIWPETSVPGYLLVEHDLFEWVNVLVKKSKTFHLVGSVDAREGGIYNSSFLFSPHGNVIGRYDKIHLTPFGETVPLQSILSRYIGVLSELGGFSSGNHYTIFHFPHGSLSVFICFESIFPNLVRKFTKEGSELLVNITNDAWFLRTSALMQHFINCVFRSIENRKFLIRAGNTGISGIISPTGKIISKTEIFDRLCLFGSVGFNDHKPIYVKFGDIFVGLCAVFLSACIFIGLIFPRLLLLFRTH